MIGENRGLDHTFGVYKPKGKRQTISNLLSKGIFNEDGTPGPHYGLAQQYSVAPQASYYVGAPKNAKTPYSAASNPMPQPNTNGAPQVQNTQFGPFQNTTEASVEKDVESKNLQLLTTGATGQDRGRSTTGQPFRDSSKLHQTRSPTDDRERQA